MASPTSFPRAGQRRALQSLDPNHSLNTLRGRCKRAPITFDQENEDAVLDGIALGIYDFQEVHDLTNRREPTPPATPNPQVDSDVEEEIIAAMSYTGGPQHGALNERSVDMQDEDNDEMLTDEMDEELGEGVDEGQAEEDDEDGDPDDQVEGAYFDPTSMGLKEINNLAHFGVSSHKPGNGVEELLSDDLDKYWQ